MELYIGKPDESMYLASPPRHVFVYTFSCTQYIDDKWDMFCTCKVMHRGLESSNLCRLAELLTGNAMH